MGLVFFKVLIRWLRRLVGGDLQYDFRSRAGIAPYFNLAANLFGPLTHSDKPKMAAIGRHQSIGFKPLAVVVNAEPDERGLIIEHDADLGGLRMFDRVCDRFLPNSQKVVFNFG